MSLLNSSFKKKVTDRENPVQVKLKHFLQGEKKKECKIGRSNWVCEVNGALWYLQTLRFQTWRLAFLYCMLLHSPFQ